MNFRATLKHIVKTKAKVLVGFILGSIAISSLFTNCGVALLSGALRPVGTSSSSSNNTQSVAVTASACSAGEVAVGLDPTNKAICEPQTAVTSGSTCPVDSSVVAVQASGSVECLVNSAWNPAAGSICPVGELMSTFTTAGAIQCNSPVSPNSGATLSCALGSYLNGVVNDQPVCVTPSVPLPAMVSCPVGQYLADLVGTTPDCQAAPWNSASDQLCVAGTVAVGWLNNQIVCQQEKFTSATSASFTCPAGQILLSFSDQASGTCSAPPNPDLSQACPVGDDVVGLLGNTVSCQVRATGSVACPIGQFVTGLANGTAVCTEVSNSHLPGACPAGSYPTGLNNGALVCASFANIQLPSPAQVCSPSVVSLCAVTGGLGSQTCSADGLTLGACMALLCSPGYDLANGACLPMACTPGVHQTCALANGTASQVCAADGSKYGSCSADSCNPGYIKCAGRCSADKTNPVYRYYNSTTGEHFFTLSNTETIPAENFKLEGIGFYVYSTKASGMIPLFRCYDSSTNHHAVTTNPACDSAAYHVEGTYGYIFSAPTSGMKPLTKWFQSNVQNGAYDTFVTINPSGEILGAYTEESTLGYVPLN